MSVSYNRLYHVAIVGLITIDHGFGTMSCCQCLAFMTWTYDLVSMSCVVCQHGCDFDAFLDELDSFDATSTTQQRIVNAPLFVICLINIGKLNQSVLCARLNAKD